MKRTIIICTTIISMFLVLGILGASVFAAINKSLGANNVIRFVGNGKNMWFVVNGQITGTTDDGDENLSTTWEYNVNDKEKSSSGEWNIGTTLTFKEDPDVSKMKITYSFSIENKGEVGINAYITGNRTTDAVFIIKVSHTPSDMLYINEGNTQNISLEISPNGQKTYLPSAIDCSFNINFIPADD